MVYVIDLLLGLVFGFILQKCGLGSYERVVGQFRLKDFTMLKFMGTAIVVGAVLTALLRTAGMVDDSTLPSDALLPAIVGGAILGCGMAISGMCPGTIFAGIGEGKLDYLVAGVAGMLAGTLVVAAIFQSVILPIHLGSDAAVPGGAVSSAVVPAGTSGNGDGNGGGEPGNGAAAGTGQGSGGDNESGAGSNAEGLSEDGSLMDAVHSLEPDEFAALAQSGQIPVLDVRSRAKYLMFAMPWEALNIPNVQLPARSEELDLNGTYLLVSSDDAEAATALAALDALGLPASHITMLAGGTNRWVAEGRPYEFNADIVAC